MKLGDVDQQEHATVTTWSGAGGEVGVRWVSYESAGFNRIYHHSSLKLGSGPTGAAVTELGRGERTDREIAAGIVNDFLAAAVKGDNQTMRRLAKPAALKEFTTYGSDWRTPSDCTIAADGPLSCQIAIGSGPPASGNFGLLFTFEVETDMAGEGTITKITFGGDTG